MAGFNLVQDILNTPNEEVTISSLTLAVGDCLELDVGATAWTEAAATSEHWQRKAIVTEATTTADTLVKVIPVNPYTQIWSVESANTANTDHNGDRMLLTDKNTVNNAGSDNTSEEACVTQVGVDGSGGKTTQILVKFSGNCNGINSDAS